MQIQTLFQFIDDAVKAAAIKNSLRCWHDFSDSEARRQEKIDYKEVEAIMAEVRLGMEELDGTSLSFSQS